MSEPERKAEVVSLREARRRREAQARAQTKAAKAKPRPVAGPGQEPMIRSWPRLLAAAGVLLALAVAGALLRML